jgi:hypothetical protein
VRNGRDVEQLPGAQLDDATVVESGGRYAVEYQTDVRNHAALCAYDWSDVLRPSPPWLVAGPADRHTADLDHLEAAQLHLAHVVGLLKRRSTTPSASGVMGIVIRLSRGIG